MEIHNLKELDPTEHQGMDAMTPWRLNGRRPGEFWPMYDLTRWSYLAEAYHPTLPQTRAPLISLGPP